MQRFNACMFYNLYNFITVQELGQQSLYYHHSGLSPFLHISQLRRGQSTDTAALEVRVMVQVFAQLPNTAGANRLLSKDVVCVFVRNARKEYITAKYVERRYVMPKEHSEPLRVYDAVKSRDLTSLLQLYAEGEDLSKPTAVPDQKVSHTCTSGREKELSAFFRIHDSHHHLKSL